MAKRRKNGEGSWGKKTINGIIYEYYKDADGKYTYGKTPKELKDKLGIKAKNKTKELQKADIDKQDFGSYISNYLKTKMTEIEPKTYDSYEDNINNMIIKYQKYDLAGKQISQLNTDIFQSYFQALAKDYARGTIKRIYSIIRQCVLYGQDRNEIDKDAFKNVSVPKETYIATKKKEVPFISLPDMELLYQESKRINIAGFNFGGKIGENTYGSNANAVVFIMYSGLRVSELCALKWKDYNEEKKTISVKGSISIIKNREGKEDKKKYMTIEKMPKSKSGYRTIPLPERAIEMINILGERFPNYTKDDFIFLNDAGKIISRYNIARTLKAMVIRANCSNLEYSPHALRHGYGSVLISKGIDIKVVSELLGHFSTSFTYDTYISTFEEDRSKVSNVFNKINNEEENEGNGKEN